MDGPAHSFIEAGYSVYDKASRVYTPKYILSETTRSRCYDEMSAHIPDQDFSMYFGGAGGPDCL
ncbi:hypothetical protein QJS04_geneDACA002506 [Acorus gramineus]|uniref:Neprosin domain-containing protein n=1 Tax=Acorus gramineus TaxID=55184 RepID=A0AAV9ATC4_ACOGR|nr:hypothetical protein QJS04_geneDACA002506 [Acorus gramineus]